MTETVRWCPNSYVCPSSGATECLCHGGFDICCDDPECPGVKAMPTSVDDLAEGSFDPRTRATVVKITDHWIVSWAEYGFNDRLLLTGINQWPWFWTAGWCYVKGGAVLLGALAFDPETQWAPPGFKKTAADERACNVSVDHGDIDGSGIHQCFCTRAMDHPDAPHGCDHDRAEHIEADHEWLAEAMRRLNQ